MHPRTVSIAHDQVAVVVPNADCEALLELAGLTARTPVVPVATRQGEPAGCQEVSLLDLIAAA